MSNFLQEKLNKVQYAEEQARVEKERSELDVMKLERELEKLQYQVGLSLNQLDFKLQLPRWNCWRRGALVGSVIGAMEATIVLEAGQTCLGRRSLAVSLLAMMVMVAIQGRRQSRPRGRGAG